MTDQITLQECLDLVEFRKYSDGEWYVDIVKGNCNAVHGDVDYVGGDCGAVEGNCGTVGGNCETVEGNCGTLEGSCLVVKGSCDMIEGSCIFVEGHVHGTINGRKWQYVETPKERFERLLEETEDEELIEAFKQLEDN